MFPSRQFGLLTAHCATYQASTSIAGGFVGAYLIKLGFGVPAALAVYAAVLGVRFLLRLAALPLVGRFGLRAALIAGVCLGAAQFVPLLRADDPAWLIAWVLVVSMSESLYWPVLHAASAVTGQGATRGSDIARRQAICALVAVAGPLLGGWTLTRFGPEADFALAGGLFLLSSLPVLRMARIPAGPVPSVRASFRCMDRVGMAAFAADGWMSSGLVLAWPMILFSTLGGGYDSLAGCNAAAAVAGAAAGLLCGRGIDRGRRDAYLRLVSAALVVTFALRAAASWSSPLAAELANALGAAVGGLYSPVIMSVIYDRSKRSGEAYRFHVAAEAGWDVGAVAGCLAGALAAVLGGAPSLAMLPAILGVLVVHACVRAEGPGGASRTAAPAGPGLALSA